MKNFGYAEAGKRCGILELGGVGHIGVKIAKAFGHHVTVISSSDRKREEALDVLGADEYLLSSDATQMQKAADSFDFILDTIPAKHPVEPYLSLLKINGKLIMLGIIPEPLHIVSPLLILGRRSIAGSFIGSMEETQEALNFCAEKNVSCQIGIASMEKLNEAMERLHKNDVRYRFVLDVAASNLDKCSDSQRPNTRSMLHGSYCGGFASELLAGMVPRSFYGGLLLIRPDCWINMPSNTLLSTCIRQGGMVASEKI